MRSSDGIAGLSKFGKNRGERKRSLAGHLPPGVPQFGGQPLCACLLPVFQDGVPYAGQLCVAAVVPSCALVVCVAEQHAEGLEVFVCGVGGEVVEECPGL